MEYRRCRICLDERDQDQMLTPCNCRGSVACIHDDCLQEYLTYYPDRMCRICLTRIPAPTTVSERMISIAMLMMLGNMIYMTNTPPLGKLAMITALAGIVWHYTLARLWVWWVLAGTTILTFLIGFATSPLAMIVMGLHMVATAFMWTLSIYIPRVYIAAGFVALITFGCIGFFATMAIIHLDPTGSTTVLTLLFLAWVAWLDSHPSEVRFGID
jgi:E3 ubiquitin-protein ligase DOA10